MLSDDNNGENSNDLGLSFDNQKKMWVQELGLTQEHKTLLQCEYGLINDQIINAFRQIFNGQYVHLLRMQDTIFAQKPSFFFQWLEDLSRF